MDKAAHAFEKVSVDVKLWLLVHHNPAAYTTKTPEWQHFNERLEDIEVKREAILSAARSASCVALVGAYNRAHRRATYLWWDLENCKARKDGTQDQIAARFDAANQVRELLEPVYDQAIKKASDPAWVHPELIVGVKSD